MSFLTSHMEAMIAAATDPLEIELRTKVLEDHLAAMAIEAQRRKEFDSLPDAALLPEDFGHANGAPDAVLGVPAELEE